MTMSDYHIGMQINSPYIEYNKKHSRSSVILTTPLVKFFQHFQERGALTGNIANWECIVSPTFGHILRRVSLFRHKCAYIRALAAHLLRQYSGITTLGVK